MGFKEDLTQFVTMAAERYALGSYIQSQDFAAEHGWLGVKEQEELSSAEERCRVLDAAMPDTWTRLKVDWPGELDAHAMFLQTELKERLSRIQENRLTKPLDEFHTQHCKSHIPEVLTALSNIRNEIAKPRYKPSSACWWALREAPEICDNVR